MLPNTLDLERFLYTLEIFVFFLSDLQGNYSYCSVLYFFDKIRIETKHFLC